MRDGATCHDHAEGRFTELRGLGAVVPQARAPVNPVGDREEVRAAGGEATAVLLLQCSEEQDWGGPGDEEDEEMEEEEENLSRIHI